MHFKVIKNFFKHTLLEACDFKIGRNISSSCPLFFTGKKQVYLECINSKVLLYIVQGSLSSLLG